MLIFPLVVRRYKDALVLLLREVLNRIQFRLNQSQLEELDDETLDDDVRHVHKDVRFIACISAEFFFFTLRSEVGGLYFWTEQFSLWLL